MKKSMLIAAMVIFAVSSCKNPGLHGDTGVIVARYMLPDSMRLSQFIESTRIITLQESSEIMISDIRTAAQLDDRFIVWLRNETGYAFCIFSNTGTFVRRIGTLGQGPQEIGRPQSFVYNKVANTIEILDNYQKRVHVFDTTGTYLREFRFEIFPDDFSVLEDGNYVLHLPLINEDANDSLVIYPGAHKFGTDGSYIKPMFTINRNNQFHITGSNAFLGIHQGASLMSSLDFNFYRFTSDTAVADFAIDFGSKAWPEDMRLKASPMEPLPTEYVFTRVFGYETSRYYFFLAMFPEPNIPGFSIADKREMNCLIYNDIYNDVTDHKIRIVGSTGEEFIGYASVINADGSDQEIQLHLFKTKQ